MQEQAGKGILLREPSVVAIADNKQVLAVGEEAKRMTANRVILAIRPMKDIVIADFDVTRNARYFIRKALPKFCLIQGSGLCPSGVTEVEKRAVDGQLSAGAKEAI